MKKWLTLTFGILYIGYIAYAQYYGGGTGGGGSGTVTVVGSGSLTKTALVTGGGSTLTQTPSATSTLDSSGNISLPGSATTCAGGTCQGALQLSQGSTPFVVASNVFGWAAPATMTTSVILQSPNAAPAAHSVIILPAPTSNVAAFAYKAIPDCTDTGGNHINFTQSTDAFSCGNSGSGGVNVNGSTVVSPNFNQTTPAAEISYANAKFQVSGSNVSAEIPVVQSGAQPSCSSTTRSTFWFLQGTGGVADVLQVCMKDAMDAYSWVTVTLP